MKTPKSLIVCLAASLSLSSDAQSQTVRIVDANGGAGSFASIQLAINASTDGDLLLVKPGIYSRSVIDGKALTLIADGPGVTIQQLSGATTNAGMDILNLNSSQAVNLAGFSVEAAGVSFTCSKALLIEDCAGPIQVRDCSFVTKPATGPFAFGPIDTSGAILSNAAAVHIVDSVFDASNSLELSQFCSMVKTMAKGLVSLESNVYVYGSTVIAGEGAPGDPIDPPGEGTIGGSGWLIHDGFGLGVRSMFSGGDGGNGSDTAGGIGCGTGGDGGPAIELRPANPPSTPGGPTFVRSSIILSPGVGGLPFEAPCTVGEVGQDIEVLAGNAIDDNFAARSFETSYLTRVGDSKDLKFVGEPFDAVWHVFGFSPANPTFVAELTGAPTLLNSFTIRFRGLIPPSGSLEVNVAVPDFGAQFIALYEEAYYFDGTRFYLSNPQFSVLLDDAF